MKRYKWGHQNPFIEGLTTLWPKKKKGQDLQNTTHKIIDRATQTTLKTGGESMYSGRVGSSCSTSETRIHVYNDEIITLIMIQHIKQRHTM